jgi:hypothetical protein
MPGQAGPAAGAPPGAVQARRILEARTARLAARRGAEPAAEPRERVLACALGPEVYGIMLHEVAEVLSARPCMPVVGAQPPVLGAIGLAGRIVSVVDLAAALGLAGGMPDGATAGKAICCASGSPRGGSRCAWTAYWPSPPSPGSRPIVSQGRGWAGRRSGIMQSPPRGALPTGRCC